MSENLFDGAAQSAGLDALRTGHAERGAGRGWRFRWQLLQVRRC